MNSLSHSLAGRQLCIAGGGTGGHVFPALALADAVRRRWPGVQVSFIGAQRGLEAKLLPERGENVLLLGMHSVQGAGLGQKLRVLFWELPRAVFSIWRQWRPVKPQLVIGVGGYASVAGVLAAFLKRVPVVLYEQNAVPGMVNRKLAGFSNVVMLGFAAAASRLPGDKCEYTGNLVASEIRQTRHKAQKLPHLIVLGGSQGAQILNVTLPGACRLLREAGHAFRVTHVAGAVDRVATLVDAYAEAGVDAEVLDFCRDMPALYAQADLMLARSGAMTVCEAAAVGLPSIFVPLPHAADNHQYHNAAALHAVGAAVLIEQHSLSEGRLAGLIGDLLFNAHRLKKMGDAAHDAQPADSEERMLAVLGRWLEVAA
ncbi:MAG: undecaprenyldiphospho-muramoylpentapeptide beta-N-acetylglucosaminyltransferase [Zetaproteobacteria bacterium CG12_big_fil_rev_8_21_14_0_65_55_1124]|nr:MAG: undecaprenyldiphospho-muramoylpentapeptide beta-N-acetylglucosaminyltransferase [Zetaproteobacteria bacterium CG1_02_55_237]PIS19910.1 MAG: undecaprenyldiphospho-muramoylpentapeptide beta-N-acetylglucosaminyltransferase [Zetaproteobacteria bacterium CG08_land_8_20_14_0_20_55_17]PIW43667.1 MAG: undecaprenyldiphospho-muramoylpentapeptide beta-N-acetylglucosaminyltransferase [Zetaproteobacteria bacterium CG12_big_fil_rev_8_21_14_0_65_55_1124]PIY52664.1 MAG: undecaprenyldiphospho-muramoylpen